MMMEKIETPQPGTISYYDTEGNIVFPDEAKYYPTMSLRDYFAGQVLSGMDLSPNVLACGDDIEKQLKNVRRIVGWAYFIADEMLKTREDD